MKRNNLNSSANRRRGQREPGERAVHHLLHVLPAGGVQPGEFEGRRGHPRRLFSKGIGISFKVDDDANVDEDMMLGLLPDHLQERAQSIMGKCLPTCTCVINIDRSETSNNTFSLF